MNLCWLIRKALDAHQDGTLGERRARRVERHLHTCTACQRELLDRQRLTTLLQSLPGPERPAEYWSGALQQLQRKMQHRPPESVRSAWLDSLPHAAENPTQALVPVALVGMALFGTVTFLGLEDEAFVFFSSYLLPIILH